MKTEIRCIIQQEVTSCLDNFNATDPKSGGLNNAAFLGVFLFLISVFCQVTTINAQVSGRVFYDYNATSTQTSVTAEPGVAGVTVNAFKPDGTFVTATTDAAGAYAFTAVQLPSGTRVRVEFTGLPIDSYDGVFGAAAGNSGTTTQFTTAGAAVTNINLGLIVPANYNEVNPLIGIPIHVSGNPLGGGSSSTMDAFASFDFNSSGNGGTIAVTNTPNDPVNHKIPASQIGSLWGVAYHKHTKKLYTSAFVKRHVGIGPLGEGGIYILDYTTGSPVVSNFVDVNTIGINTGTVGVGATPALRNINRGLNNTANQANVGGDPLAFDAVGKIGLGDIDISEDGSKLWVVNLNLLTLNSIVIDSDNNPSTAPTAADVTTFNIPNPFTAGTQRPFALKTYNGKVYVGLVSDATLEAAVYEFSGGTFTPVLVNGLAIIPLNYPKGFASNNCPTITGWFNWRNSNPPIVCSGTTNFLYSYPTPMLCDIEFDIDGSLILTFMDRMGHQIGSNNTQLDGTDLENYHGAGDILRVCRVGGAYVMQGSSGCAVKATNNQGPGGGEYYFGDYFDENESYFPGTAAGSRGVLHSETVVGGMALVYGSGESVVASYDPRGIAWVSGGVNFFNNTTGQTRARNYMLYYGQTTGFAGNGFSGKANGIGDVEVISSLPTIEVGNRVWNDINKNGIQDPNEAVLVGVTVSLYDSLGVLVPNSTLVTDANGQFIFSSAPGTSTANFKYGLNIRPNTQYQIKIDALGTNTSVTGLTLADVTPLTPGETAAINSGSTISNNDAKLLGGKPTVVFRTGILGENNHTFDLGLACTQPIVTASSYTRATCPAANNVVPNNTASLQISTDGDRVAISPTGVPTTAYGSAPAVTAGSVTLINQNGATDSLYVRIFKGPNCYIDTIFKVTPIICCPAITFGTPANFTQYCSEATIPTLTATTTARLPDSLAFYMSPTKLTGYNDIVGAQLLGKVRIVGTAVSNNNVSLTNVKLPELIGTTNDTLYIYSVYVDDLGDTTCKVFVEKPIILRPEPVAMINGFSTICNATPLTLSSQPATSYKWGRVSPPSSTLGAAQTLTITPPSNTTTTYWLITTNAGTCSSDTAFHTVTSSGGILGTVYRDLDSDGVKDANETFGVKDIEVKAYDCASNLLETTTTDEFGRYVFSSITTGTGKVRIEFSKSSMPTWLQESFAGTGNGTNVQFVTAPSCAVDLGVKEENDFCQTNPFVAIPQYNDGPATGTTAALVRTPYPLSGTITSIANFGQVGATWGTAYQRTSKTIFNSSFLKRHVGLAQGTGHIFMSNSTTGFIGSFDLQGVNGIDLGSVTRTATGDNGINATNGGIDLDAFAKVGKVSFGDIDLYDQKTLFAINLNSRSLIEVDVSDVSLLPTNGSAIGASLVKEYALSLPSCNGGVMRPFALKIHNGKGYLGAVCDASISGVATDLGAFVYTFDPKNPGGGLTQVLNFSLNYPREEAGFFGTQGAYPSLWLPWKDVYATLGERHVSPIFGDIEFAEDGSMIIGMMDRVGDQYGGDSPIPVSGATTLVNKFSAGDILKACNVNGVFLMEGTTGACPVNDQNNDTHFVNNGVTSDGISGNGEFFWDEFYRRSDTGHGHGELALGGLAVLPGTKEVLTVMYDPLNLGQQGMARFSTVNGGRGGQIILVNNPGPLNKANGIGDVELLCDPAPIQIGNYVWFDANNNGIQDACEVPMAGVKVYLYTKTGVLKDSTVTNATGNYYFSSPTDSITTNTAYYIVFGGPSQFNTTTSKLTVGSLAFDLSPSNTGTGTNSDQNDSDASTSIAGLPSNLVGLPVICDTTGGAGYINHTLDLGLYRACNLPVATLSVTSATCVSTTAQNNGTIRLNAIANADKFAVSVGNTFTGAAYAAATTIGALPMNLQAAIPNAGATYTIRFYSGWDQCFKDTTIFVAPFICTCPTVTITVPADNTTLCSGSTFNLTISTTAKSPDSIRVISFSSAQSGTSMYTNTPDTVIAVIPLGTAATNTGTTSFKLPKLYGNKNDTFFIYAILNNTSFYQPTCRPFDLARVINKVEPIANITGFDFQCNGSGITLTSNPAASYKWGRVGATGVLATTQTYAVTPTASTSTTYWLVVSNAATPACPSDTVFHTITMSNGILGTAFRDFNSNGIKDANETYGMEGIEVKAYDCNGNLLGTTTTDENGRYAFPNISAATGRVRIEFDKSSLSIYEQESFAGTDNGTDVQFVTAPNCSVDWGVKEISDYCQANPNVAIPIYLNGGAINATVANQNTIIQIPYSANSTTAGSLNINLAQSNETGTVYGIAYQKDTKKMFMSAFVKRHTGLLDNDNDGNGDLGAIYQLDAATNTVTLFTIIPNAGTIGSDATRGLGAFTSTSRDPSSFSKVGKEGLGDMDISEDGQYLYVVNLFSKELVRIDIATKTQTTYPIPTGGCTNGVRRPFGLGIRNGKVYLGTVCTGENSGTIADLVATVYAFDGNAFTSVLDFPLNYTKGYALSSGLKTSWLTWTDNANTFFNTYSSCCFTPNGAIFTYNQPILSDIDFDDNGQMLLGFMDRGGHQAGWLNLDPGTSTQLWGYTTGGDLLTAYPNSSATTWTLESGGDKDGVGSYTPIASQINNQGPGGGEFYFDENFTASHQETAQGGLAALPHSGSFMTTIMDPSAILQGGVKVFSTTNGSTVTSYPIFVSSLNANIGTFGKAAGLGDLEILCDQAPIQIGNYVWLDANKDGIQDPCELPAVGVKVFLYTKAGVLKDSTVTNASGNYYFSSPADSIKMNTAYYIVFGGTSQFNTTNSSLTLGSSQYSLTQADTGTGTNTDQNDSDASSTIAGLPSNLVGYPVICDSTGGPGYINHTLDVGLIPYVPCVLPTFTFTQTAPTCTSAGASINDGKITLTALSNADKYGVSVGASYTGPVYSSATTIGTTPIDVRNSIPNTGGTYTIRLFNGTNACFKDTTITVDAVPCTVILGSLGDKIWKDLNNNGRQDVGESGVKDVIIELYKNGVLLGKDTSDVLGKYEFTNLDSASYYIKVVAGSIPSDCLISQKANESGVPDSLDSDIIPATLQSQTVIIDPTPMAGVSLKDNPTLDVALRLRPTLAILDPCSCFRVEYRITEIKELFERMTITSSPGETWRVVSQTGMLELDSFVKIPLAIGALFTESPAGKYNLEYTIEDNVVYTAKLTNGTDTLTYTNMCSMKYADITLTLLSEKVCKNSAPIPLAASSNTPGPLTFFYVNKVTGQRVNITSFDPSQFSANDTIYVKLEAVPTDPSKCRTTLVQPVVITTLNCDKGILGDYVWKDANNNGRQDVGETGVKDVIIELYKNGVLLGKDTTDVLGKYEFTSLDSASYYIKVVASSIPAGCLISQKANESGVPDSLDSDIIPATLQSQTVIIDPTPTVGVSLKDNPTLDVALFSPVVGSPCGTMTLTAIPTICTPSTNLYDVSGEVSFTSTPTTGTLTITKTGGGSVTLNAPFTSPMVYTIPNLVSNGMTHTVTAVFSEDPTFCTESVDYTAPASCNTLPCNPICLPISVIKN
jgi:hypothetical protein